jgi:hypothetical protein
MMVFAGKTFPHHTFKASFSIFLLKPEQVFISHLVHDNTHHKFGFGSSILIFAEGSLCQAPGKKKS